MVSTSLQAVGAAEVHRPALRARKCRAKPTEAADARPSDGDGLVSVERRIEVHDDVHDERGDAPDGTRTCVRKKKKPHGVSVVLRVTGVPPPSLGAPLLHLHFSMYPSYIPSPQDH